MKSLEDYIELKNNKLLFSFYQEWGINECLEASWFNDINENYGVYDGQIELIQDLAKDILKWYLKTNEQQITFNKEQLHNYKNIFFNELKIIVDSESSYSSSESSYNKDKQVFNKIVLHIDIDDVECSNYKSLTSSLIHELTHAYQDYSKRLKTNGAIGLSYYRNAESDYYMNLSHDTKSSIDIISKDILYRLDNFEISAFISQANISMTNIIKKNMFISYKTAYKKMLKNEELIKLLEIKQQLRQIEERDYRRNKFVQYYNNVKQTNLSFNKIKTIIENKVNKIINKLNAIAPKIYYDAIQQIKLNESLNSEIYVEPKHISKMSENLCRFTKFIEEKYEYKILYILV